MKKKQFAVFYLALFNPYLSNNKEQLQSTATIVLDSTSAYF